MPPRTKPSSSTRGRATSARATPLTGAAASRVGSAGQGPLQTSVADSVTTVGVKRPGYGTAGKAIRVFVNTCAVNFDKVGDIYQYDVVVMFADGKEKSFPKHLARQIFACLQPQHPNVFLVGSVAYDGAKIAYANRLLDFGHQDTPSREFAVTFTPTDVDDPRPTEYKIKLTCAMDDRGSVKKLNPEVLRRYVAGQQSNEAAVSEVINALMVVVRMHPFALNKFSGRSFYSSIGSRPISLGMEAWQGYIQSLRPVTGRLLMNLDITSAVMYKSGSVLQLAIEYINHPSITKPAHLSPDYTHWNESMRRKLGRFIAGMRVIPTIGASGKKMRKGKPVTVNVLTSESAARLTFAPKEGGASITVAEYFRLQNQPLTYPHVICIQTTSGACYPLERCDVVPGQLVKKEIPPAAVANLVQFSTKAPGARFAAIKSATSVFGYGVSEYVREFGLVVNTDGLPMGINGRILPPPKMEYGKRNGKRDEFTPQKGVWNMANKKLYKPMGINGWVMVVLDPAVTQATAISIAEGFIAGCESVDMKFNPQLRFPLMKNGQPENATGIIASAGKEFFATHKRSPPLLVAVLPEHNNAPFYSAVKHFGMCNVGVATQCLLVNKCTGARMQYWANVALKVNGKLGGINVIPAPSADTGPSAITDPAMPTIVFGADVTHPPPGSHSPSYAAVVSNRDSQCASYMASDSVQGVREEMIVGMQGMVEKGLREYIDYRSKTEKVNPKDLKPKRLLYFRDGVSEGERQKVLDIELPQIKAACTAVGVQPKITVLVVVKRHHIRFKDDGSANLPAGTVVDTDITSPYEHDFFLQSHAPLLGTSRSGYYRLLHDENNFSADAIQRLSYTLCHTYARATRSVSIPTPVYYAHLVCDKAKLHYKPNNAMTLSDAGSEASSEYITQYQPLHNNLKNLQWWL